MRVLEPACDQEPPIRVSRSDSGFGREPVHELLSGWRSHSSLVCAHLFINVCALAGTPLFSLAHLVKMARQMARDMSSRAAGAAAPTTAAASAAVTATAVTEVAAATVKEGLTVSMAEAWSTL